MEPSPWEPAEGKKCPQCGSENVFSYVFGHAILCIDCKELSDDPDDNGNDDDEEDE